MNNAVASFDIESWDESPCEGQPTGFAQATVHGRYQGDLAGTGTWQMLLKYFPDGTASCVWLEEVAGQLGERAGTFVLRHTGRFAETTVTVSSEVVPGSGTGELAGLRGNGGYTASEGRTIEGIALDYEFAS